MRIVFLMGKWNDGVEISPDMRAQADNWESTISVSTDRRPTVVEFIPQLTILDTELLHKHKVMAG